MRDLTDEERKEILSRYKTITDQDILSFKKYDRVAVVLKYYYIIRHSSIINKMVMRLEDSIDVRQDSAMRTLYELNLDMTLIDNSLSTWFRKDDKLKRAIISPVYVNIHRMVFRNPKRRKNDAKPASMYPECYVSLGRVSASDNNIEIYRSVFNQLSKMQLNFAAVELAEKTFEIRSKQ